jgi:serine/threonine protein kinase
MPPTLEGFVRSISDAGLMDAEDLRVFIKDLPESARPASAEEMAKALVRSNRLTKFQAQLVYQGRAKALVIGNYVIEDKLGEGGMGQVYRARHRRMDRSVALKVLPATATKSDDSVKRFRKEVKAAGRLLHPNIITAHDADEENGVYFLAMEYVDGEDLAQIVKRRGALPVDMALDYMIQAAQGLQYAHEQGVIHRDIKPSNMLVDRRGTVKILDMGLARLLNAATVTEDGLTRAGQVMGTIDYIAPEQAIDTKHADQRSDIYSLGCTLYYLLTGSVVFREETIVKKILAHTRQAAPSLRADHPEIPETLETLYRRMLAKDPAERPQTMSEVVAALQACRGSSPANAVDAPVPPGESAATNSDSQQVELITSQKKDPANLKSADTATPAANINSSFSPPLDQETVALPWARASDAPRFLQFFARLTPLRVVCLTIIAVLIFVVSIGVAVSSWRARNGNKAVTQRRIHTPAAIRTTSQVDGIGTVGWVSMLPDPNEFSGWEIGESKFRYEKGELTFPRSAANEVVTTKFAVDAQDMIFRIKVKMPNSPGNGVWISLRGSGRSGCLMLIHDGSGGNLTLRKSVPEHGQYALATLRGRHVDMDMNEFHELALAAVGRTFIGYFDGYKVFEAHDSDQPGSGDIWFGVGGETGDPVFTQPEYSVLDGIPALELLRQQSVDAECEVAEWLIANAGNAGIRVASKETIVSDVASLPREPFTVIEAKLPQNVFALEVDPVLALFHNLTQLERLDLAGTSVTDDGLKHIGNLQTLKVLDLARTRVTPEAAVKLRATLPKCRIQLDFDVLKAADELQKRTKN